jgi:hypothetical protein
MTETAQDAYDRGADAGRIEARLSQYDKHFQAINGSVADTARELHALTLAVQRLGDQADASAATVLATASALKAADEARRDKTEQSWSPIQKVLAAVAGIAALVGAALGIKAAAGR